MKISGSWNARTRSTNCFISETLVSVPAEVADIASMLRDDPELLSALNSGSDANEVMPQQVDITILNVTSRNSCEF